MMNVVTLHNNGSVAWIGRLLVVMLCMVFSVSSERAYAGDPVASRDAYLAAWNSHDASKAAGFLTEDVVYYDAAAGEPQIGRENARKNIIESFMTAAPDSKWVPLGEAVLTGNTVAFEWSYTGTNTGDWADGTKATGKSFNFKGMSIFRFNDEGKIVYQGDYYDALGFFKQLGLM